MLFRSVSIRKVDGQTGVTRPSDVGILAILSTAPSGTANVAEEFLSNGSALGEFGNGPLVQFDAYVEAVTGNPRLLVKTAGSTAGSIGSITSGAGNTGTSAVTADGGSHPYDTYENVTITVIHGGTVGVTGITYTYSLDGGHSTSAVLAAGTDAFISIPDTGIEVDLGTGTLVAGDTFTFSTTGTTSTNTDLVNALEALRLTSNNYEAILFDGNADATTVTTIDTWIQARQAEGKFKLGFVSARPRHLTGETEAQYVTYLQGVFGSTASINVVVCADVGDVVAPVPGVSSAGATQTRSTGLAIAAKTLAYPIGHDPAQVSDGPLLGFAINDAKGNPNHHDEYKNPGVDALRIASLRTWPGLQGTFITNAPVLSSSGSDYVYVQHARVMNQACEIAFQILTQQLSAGVNKSPKVGPQGQRYIAEGNALRIESLVNAALTSQLAGQVDGVRFSLSRTDDISSNSGATVTGSIQSVALGYIKKFTVTAGFVKAIS